MYTHLAAVLAATGKGKSRAEHIIAEVQGHSEQCKLWAMLHALLHGKLDELRPDPQKLEDALTSTVFGTIFLAEDWKLLENWLYIPFEPTGTASLPEYWFWPRLGSVEPDVVIRFANSLVVVEAKYRSGRHDLNFQEGSDERDQLLRQYKALTEPLSERRQYPTPIEDAIVECQLIQVYVVDARDLRRARHEFEESRDLIFIDSPNANLKLVTWQTLYRALHTGSTHRARWREVLGEYLRICSLDCFEGFSAWSASEKKLAVLRDWISRARQTEMDFHDVITLNLIQATTLLSWEANSSEFGWDSLNWVDFGLGAKASRDVIFAWCFRAGGHSVMADSTAAAGTWVNFGLGVHRAKDALLSWRFDNERTHLSRK